MARSVLSLRCMPPSLLTEIAARILIVAVDLGWTPPAWRSEAVPEPFSDVEAPLNRVAQAIDTQRTLSTPRDSQ